MNTKEINTKRGNSVCLERVKVRVTCKDVICISYIRICCSDFGYIQSYIRSLEQHVTFSLRFNVTLISYIRLSTFILKLTEHTMLHIRM